ncbi:hypothetical protein EU245_08290 [Lentibacillus lipolyticus]|nr:hypothetical protein EU245_08290 [Lentibacillus lipolyticus]
MAILGPQVVILCPNRAIPGPEEAILLPHPAIPAPEVAIPGLKTAILPPHRAIPDPEVAILPPHPAIPDSEVAILGPDWAILGPQVAILLPHRAILGPQVAILLPYWAILGPQVAILLPHWAILGPQVAILLPHRAIPGPEVAILPPHRAIPEPEVAIPDPEAAIPGLETAILNPEVAILPHTRPPNQKETSLKTFFLCFLTKLFKRMIYWGLKLIFEMRTISDFRNSGDKEINLPYYIMGRRNMRKGIWIAVFAVLVSLVTPSLQADAEKTFSDVPEDFWAADAIYRFAEAGVIEGYEDDSFGVNDELTRAHAAIILANALDLEMPDSDEVTNYFDDVEPDHPYADYIAATGKAGVINGSDGAFMPNKKLTRQQMASVLVSAFDLESGEKSVDVNLSNVAPSHQDNVQVLADLGVTNQLDDFRPNENISRAGFTVMLAQSVDNSKDVSELLKEAYANEMELDSYEFEGSANLGLSLPESLQSTPEQEMAAMMMEDIQVDISGSYQKDPMMMDASVDVTMKGDMETTISIPMIMTEEKMWMKFPNTPAAPLPEELDGKFIEFDMQELQEMQGQPSVDMDVQTEFALAVQNLFVDYFADDYYTKAEAGSYDVPEGVDAKQVLQFELTNEDLKPFVETLLTGFMPEFLEILENPEYQEALGLTEEEIKQAQEEMATVKENIDAITSEVDNTLQINTFEEYVVINHQNYIAHNAVELDVDVTAEQETFGLQLSADQTKQNINGDISIDTPDADETISMEELSEIEPPQPQPQPQPVEQ